MPTEKREPQSSSKKARVEPNNGEAEAGAGALVAVAGAVAQVELTVRIDKAKLHCPICKLPFKPPIFQFQCEAGHLACSTCHGELPKDQCYACHHAGAYRRNTTLEDVVGWPRVPCAYSAYGCRSYVTYHEAGEHRRECPCAPCGCPEPGCGFVGSPPALRGHVGAVHRPVLVVRYGQEFSLAFAAAQRWQALAAQGDGSLFVVSLGARGADTAAVSLVCLRANGGGGAAAQYTCRVALETPGGGDGDGGAVFTMESKVSSSSLSGGLAELGQPVFMGVDPQLVPCDTLLLSIRIDMLRPTGAAAAAAAAAAASTGKSTPRARLCKQQH
ncbi:hypothetical protein ACP4OV_021916 [Aristida adscensionis]